MTVSNAEGIIMIDKTTFLFFKRTGNFPLLMMKNITTVIIFDVIETATPLNVRKTQFTTEIVSPQLTVRNGKELSE